jgi:hypothetical protein
MENNQQRIKGLLTPLFADYDKEIFPADAEKIDLFINRCKENGVPSKAADQLVEFYRVTDGVPCLDSFDFHTCDDLILFEWWDDKELWLAQRDYYTIRWSTEKRKFCLGDASNVSLDEKYEFDSLIELLEAAFSEWYGEETTVEEPALNAHEEEKGTVEIEETAEETTIEEIVLDAHGEEKRSIEVKVLEDAFKKAGYSVNVAEIPGNGIVLTFASQTRKNRNNLYYVDSLYAIKGSSDYINMMFETLKETVDHTGLAWKIAQKGDWHCFGTQDAVKILEGIG